MGKFFSVILPVHNGEKYFTKMLDSIASQTFRDFELIIVCDKCDDNTADIAKDYDRKVPEISVIEVDYGKCGLSRNMGLDNARGEWILFADDDDWFLHDYVFENIADVLQGSDGDVLNFSFIWKRGDKNVYTQGYRPDSGYHMWVAPWCRAIRREWLGEHRFPAWKHSDDLGFAEEVFPLMLNAKMAWWDAPIYYYNYMHEGSIQDRLAKGELSNADMRE